MESVLQDLRVAFRTMKKNRGLTTVVVLSVGLAIGANTAVFSVVNGFLIRPWGVEDFDRVVRVRQDFAQPGQAPDIRGFRAADLALWQRENTVFESMAAGTGNSVILSDKDGAERISAATVSWNFFPVIGIKPLLGRTFSQEEDAPNRDDAVVLGFRIWQSRFGGDPAVLGRVITLNGRPHTVIGVMPKGLRHPYESDMWVPLGYREDPASSDEFYVPARLKPGVTVEQANAELDAMAQRIYQANPGPNVPTGANVNLLRPEMLGELTRVLYLLSAAAVFVLLIACANISNLLLAQSLSQGTEVAVRTALGASRGRLVRQFLTYSVLLSAAGGLVGVILTLWTVKPLVALSPLYGAGEFDIEPRLDLATLGFTFLISLTVGVIFGLIPAFRLSNVSLVGPLKGGRGTMPAATRRLLGSFVVVEVALALLLLAGAGLVYRSLENLRNEDRGFDRTNVLSFAVTLPNSTFPQAEQKVGFIRDALARLKEVPGVEAVGATTVQPLWAGSSLAAFVVEGKEPSSSRGYELTHSRIVTPGYLETMKIPLLAGRDITEADNQTAPAVVVVSKSIADRYWPGESPIGKRVKRGRADSQGPWLTVVGVVGTLKENQIVGLPDSDAWYLPYAQSIPVDGLDEPMTFMLKSRSAVATLLPAARTAIASINRDLPIFDVQTMEQRFSYRTQTERFSSRLYGSIGALGLLLAAIGIYAVLAFMVNQRMPEMGIRSALGARPSEVRMLILRNAMWLAGSGLVFGLVAAMFLTHFLGDSLYQIGPRDPVTFGSAFLVVTATALISSLIPANRAAKVDPVRALKLE